MYIPPCPRELAEQILERSTCHVQVGAVLADQYGVFSWGWNHNGADGLGCHAERHAIIRANKRRLAGSTIYVAGQWNKHRKLVLARPCFDCLELLQNYHVGRMHYRTHTGKWTMERV